jgi:bacillithiol biosynthesis cysteine-adding enzyme BshC
LEKLIDRAADAAPGSEHREEVRTFLHEALAASNSLADWTCRILARLFRDSPLVFFSPHLPTARSLAIPILETCIAHPLEDTRILNEAGARLSALGYEAQVVKDHSVCNFFLEVEGKRRKVVYQDEAFRLPDEDVQYAPEELRTILRSDPERFSPNVALRCVVQQRLFSPAAYVAGPGEIAYWAQLKPVFEHFGANMPVVYPRARAVITDIKLNKLLNKLGLTIDDLREDPDTLLERSLAVGSGGAVVRQFQKHRTEIERVFEDLEREIKIGDMTEQLRERIRHELDRFERGLLRADETALQTTTLQLRRLCNSLLPGRRPQERFYNVFSFLFKQGWGLAGRLIQGLDVESFDINEVEL